MVFAATLATFLVPVPFPLQATDYGDILLGSCKAHNPLLGGKKPCGAPAFRHVSLVQWTNRLLTATGAVVRTLGVQTTLGNWDYLLELSHYILIITGKI